MDQLRRLKKWQLCFMVCGMQLIINSVHASSTPLCSIPSPRHYVRSLRAYIADLKSAFVESGDYSPETALTEGNFGTVLSGLVNNVGVNGIRVPIIPDYATPASYSDLYRKIYGYARRNGLLIYASPLGYGPVAYNGWSDERYAAWIAAYSAAFKPNFLSPFNEAGFDNVRIRDIMTRLRPKLGAAVFLVGPDKGTCSIPSRNSRHARRWDPCSTSCRPIAPAGIIPPRVRIGPTLWPSRRTADPFGPRRIHPTGPWGRVKTYLASMERS